MDTDADLAWGRMRFSNGKSPDVTISLACYKARYDLVEAMAFHPSAEFYLPTNKPLLKRPCPKLCLDDLIEDLVDYNNGKGNDHRRQDRDRCLDPASQETTRARTTNSRTCDDGESWANGCSDERRFSQFVVRCRALPA